MTSDSSACSSVVRFMAATQVGDKDASWRR